MSIQLDQSFKLGLRIGQYLQRLELINCSIYQASIDKKIKCFEYLFLENVVCVSNWRLMEGWIAPGIRGWLGDRVGEAGCMVEIFSMKGGAHIPGLVSTWPTSYFLKSILDHQIKSEVYGRHNPNILILKIWKLIDNSPQLKTLELWILR